jgi:glycosyltransferase involved in cell wall biosynthesis
MKASGLRVGLVGPAPPPNGGMAMQTRQLGELLAGEGVYVEMLATNAPYKPSWIEHFPVVRAAFRLLPYLFRTWRLAGRVDVIHMMANSGWSWQLFSAPVVWVAWLRRTPVIINYRGGEALAYFRQSFARVKPTVEKASDVVVPSRFLQQVFADYGLDVSVIPNIINLERFTPGAPGKGSALYTLVVARNLEPIYGIETAIKAVSLVQKDIPEIHLMVAGSGPQREELEALVRSLALQGKVEFVGRLEPNDMVALYQGSDAMLNPATVDNMPNSILEAMACAVPVISTDVGGVPFLVKHEVTALLVPAADERRMADAIKCLYLDRELGDTLARAGLEDVRQYAWSEVKDQWLGLYQKAVVGGDR